MNSESDCEGIKELIKDNCIKGEIPIIPDTETPVFLQVIQRNELSILDWGKVIDAIIVVFSCKNVDMSKAKMDPSTCQAIDEMGYNVLSLLRTQGLPPVIGVLQHLETNSSKKQKEIKKLFTRYYESEFPNSYKLCNSSKPMPLLRTLATSIYNIEEPGYKAFRSYMWPHIIEHENSSLKLTGFLKGSGLLNANQLIHITGYGDFSMYSLRTPNAEYFPNNPESLIAENDPGAFAAEQTWPNENDLVDAFSRLEVKTDHPPNDIDEDEDDELEMCDDEKQPFEFEERNKEDLDFPDEVNTPHDQPAKIRFQKYRGLASFRTSQWDPYENLPVSYGKLYEFKEPNHIIKKISLDTIASTSQTSFGMLITITINNFPIGNMNPDLPIILSSLLPHERKLSVINFKLERWGNTEEKISSKEPICIHYGFRRVICKPIYSEDSNLDKSKYLREFKDAGHVIASIYAPVTFPVCNAIVFKECMEGPKLVAVGSLLSFDPKRLIIKRILLTGYPLKVIFK